MTISAHAAAVLIVLVTTAHMALFSQHLFVSPRGSDASSGIDSSAPLATLTRAVSRVNELRSASSAVTSHRTKQAVIELLPGTY
ncbi:MAG TPA: hypothetical protein VK470_18400, partial [Bacteroidota bacterium]|nr:hypothetical protein [Bacteroidota bacterium]